MRILISGINYSPELTGIGKYTGELAEWLVLKGHEVRVVTAPPYYPEWKISKPYSSWKYSKETNAGVSVWRSPLWVPSTPSGIKRLLHLLSFALSSAPVMFLQVFWRPNVILTIEPPLFCAPVAWLVAKLAGSRSWLHIQDFELDAAFDLGLLKGERSKEIALGIERALLNRFDTVSTISNKMLEKLGDKGIDPNKTILFPNWVDLKSFEVTDTIDFRKQLGIPDDAVVALYSGNMGGKQGLEILGTVAQICDEFSEDGQQNGSIEKPPKIIFVFCGAGSGRRALELSCVSLQNIHFLDLQPLEYLSSLLNMAHIHLLPQRTEVEDLVMPSKLTGMLASGRPVITNASPTSALANVVREYGLVVEPANGQAFALAVQKLARDKSLRMHLGEVGRQYAKNHLAKEEILSSFELKLQESHK